MAILEWLAPWEFSMTFVVVFFLSAGLYVRYAIGKRAGDARATTLQQASFWVGMAAVYVVTQTGFDFYAEHEFFIHRLQHLVQHHLGPFLIVLGVPDTLYRASGAWVHAKFRQAGRTLSLVRALLRLAAHPTMSAVLFNLLLLFWLLPSVHLAGMLDWRWYRVMNFGMLLNGLLFWAAVLRGAAPLQSGDTTLTPLRRIILMVAVVPVQILVGAVIFMTPVELYPVYTMCGRAFRGITALQDQQIGGLVLWIPGAMMSVAGILLVLRERFTVAPPARA